MQWLKVQSPKFHICIAIWSHLQRPAYTGLWYTRSLQGADHHNYHNHTLLSINGSLENPLSKKDSLKFSLDLYSK